MYLGEVLFEVPQKQTFKAGARLNVLQEGNETLIDDEVRHVPDESHIGSSYFVVIEECLLKVRELNVVEIPEGTLPKRQALELRAVERGVAYLGLGDDKTFAADITHVTQVHLLLVSIDHQLLQLDIVAHYHFCLLLKVRPLDE